MKPTGWQIPYIPWGYGGIAVVSCTAFIWDSIGCNSNNDLYYVVLQNGGASAAYISQDIYPIPSSISFDAKLRANNQVGNKDVLKHFGNTLSNLFVVSLNLMMIMIINNNNNNNNS
jgi:hypothetical protein